MIVPTNQFGWVERGYPNTHWNGFTISKGFQCVLRNASVSSDPLNNLELKQNTLKYYILLDIFKLLYLVGFNA